MSGFFGGFSGNQGALRSAFLLKAGLSKEGLIATGVVVAVIVDAARLLVYGAGALAGDLAQSRQALAPVAVATACAFVGSFVPATTSGPSEYRTLGRQKPWQTQWASGCPRKPRNFSFAADNWRP